MYWCQQAKQKQKETGAQRLMLPSVQGQDTGKWVVVDSGMCCVLNSYIYIADSMSLA